MKQKYAIKNGISEGIVYEESAPYSNSIKAIITLGFFVLALSSFFAFFGHFVGSNKAPEQAQFALLFAAYIYALIMWGFFNMRKSAVEIEKRSGFFRRLVLTTQNPEEFVKTIKENLE